MVYISPRRIRSIIRSEGLAHAEYCLEQSKMPTNRKAWKVLWEAMSEAEYENDPHAWEAGFIAEHTAEIARHADDPIVAYDIKDKPEGEA